MTDLLAPDQRARLAVREDLARGVYVEGLSEETVTSGGPSSVLYAQSTKRFWILRAVPIAAVALHAGDIFIAH